MCVTQREKMIHPSSSQMAFRNKADRPHARSTLSPLLARRLDDSLLVSQFMVVSTLFLRSRTIALYQGLVQVEALLADVLFFIL